MPTHDHEVEKHALEIFPRLYYLIPIFRPREQKVGPQNITISEPMDGILWLLELLTLGSNKKTCLQGHLEDMVCRWYSLATPSTFNKKLNALDEAGFITKVTHLKDKRANQLRLTKPGKLLLANIKSKRLEMMAPLIRAATELTSPEREEVLAALYTLAHAAWDKTTEMCPS